MGLISLTWLLFLISAILMQLNGAFSIGVWVTVAIEGILGPLFVYFDFFFFQSAANYFLGSPDASQTITTEKTTIEDPNADSPFVEIEFLRKLEGVFRNEVKTEFEVRE